jgi:small multidrug resistance family-3 protein
MTALRSILLSMVAALAEISGAWLVWQGVREHRGVAWTGAGVVALGLNGFVATLQPDAHFSRILAAYGGAFVAGSMAWGMLLDGFRPDRFNIIGTVTCPVGVAVIIYAPRSRGLTTIRLRKEAPCRSTTRPSSGGSSRKS